MNEDVTEEKAQKLIEDWVEETKASEELTTVMTTADVAPTPSSTPLPLTPSSSAAASTTARPQSELLARHDNWVNLLGVRNKPDLLTDWDHLYNLKNQTALRRDCCALIERLGDETTITVSQLESLVTLYCKRRRVEYTLECGWLAILEKLVVLPFEQATLFNVFYAITTKYIPRSSKAFDLFRLIIQYHDPELSSYLESLKVQPEEFTRDWFEMLLSRSTTRDLCWRLWDEYFERGDPFLIFFISLAFARCSRDEILTMKVAADVRQLLRNTPSQMSTDDVADLLDICYVFLNYTPLSVREDFHCMLFGSNLVDECSDFQLNRLMCLPISVQELYKRVIDNTFSSNAVVTYFVIDTRSQKAFNSGSIAGSYNLNGKLIVDEPEKFNIAMTSLMHFKENSCRKDHICFIGSGLEDDDSYMMMVISRFLHQNRPHISYVDGGYKALHALLSDTGNLQKLSNHFNVSECTECLNKGKKSTESRGWSLMERMKKAMQSRRTSIRSIKSPSFSKQSNRETLEPVKHVNSTERFGKKYRNMQSVFSINDDERVSDDELNISDVEPSEKIVEKLKWSDVTKKSEIIDHFQGHEVFPDKSQVPCFIALSRTHMHIFHNIVKEPGHVKSSFRHALSSVMRVTSKKKIPEFLTFKFGYELPTGEAHINRVHCFIIPRAGDCAKAVKTAIISIKPSLIDAQIAAATDTATSVLDNTLSPANGDGSS